MALVGAHAVNTFTVPVNKFTGAVDANEVRGNDNALRVAYNTHDADSSIHTQSGTLANRPVAPADGSIYVGTDTGEIYIYVSGAWVTIGGTPRYGAWSDYTDQTTVAANTATLMTFNTTDVVSGTSLVSSSRMTVGYTGVYNFQWSGQFTNTDSAEQDVDIWIRINGTDVVGSAGRVSVPKRHGSIDGHALPGWNYYLSLTANDYVQLYWAATNTSVSLQTVAAASPIPSTASLIATMEKVS